MATDYKQHTIEHEAQPDWDGKKLPSIKWENCERMPLFNLPDETEVIDILAVPELHLYTGIPCKFLKELKKLSPEAYNQWLKKNNVSPDGLGEFSFNGNSVTKLLCDIPSLETIAEDLQLGKPADLIVTALDSFNEVVDKWFGMESKEDYELTIKQFMIDHRKVYKLLLYGIANFAVTNI